MRAITSVLGAVGGAAIGGIAGDAATRSSDAVGIGRSATAIVVITAFALNAFSEIARAQS